MFLFACIIEAPVQCNHAYPTWSFQTLPTIPILHTTPHTPYTPYILPILHMFPLLPIYSPYSLYTPYNSLWALYSPYSLYPPCSLYPLVLPILPILTRVYMLDGFTTIDPTTKSYRVSQKGYRNVRWFIGDFTLTPQYFASSLSVNCHDSQFHLLPTMKFASSLSVL